MSKITISGDTTKSKEEIENQLLGLIRSRLSAIKEEISTITSEIEDFEEKYDMDRQEFQQKFVSGDLGDDRDYFVWDGLLGVLDDLTTEQDTLRELL